MIQLVEGKGVGSGKTALVVELLIHHLRQGGSAFASETFEIKWDKVKAFVKKRYGLILEDDQYKAVKNEDIYRLHEVTSGGTDDMPVLIIVDEAQEGLNARDWNDSKKRELFQWACQSRHDSNDLIFATQSVLNIDKQLRRITTYTWTTRNLDKFPLPGLGITAGAFLKGLIAILTLGIVRHHGVLFYRVLLDWDGKSRLDGKLVRGDQAIFDCYNSKSCKAKRPRLGQPIARKQLQREKKASPMYRYLIPALLVLVIIGVFYIAKNGIIPKPKTTPVATVIASKPEPPKTFTSNSTATPAPAYDVERHKLLGLGKQWVKTVSGGFYTPGKMSTSGMVEAIQFNVVRVRKPDNRVLYIVAEDWTPPPPPPAPVVTHKSDQIVIAHDATKDERPLATSTWK